MTSDAAIEAALRCVTEQDILHLADTTSVTTEFLSAQQFQEICDMWGKKDVEVADRWIVRFQRLYEGKPWEGEFIMVFVRDRDGFASLI